MFKLDKMLNKSMILLVSDQVSNYCSDQSDYIQCFYLANIMFLLCWGEEGSAPKCHSVLRNSFDTCAISAHLNP